MTEFLEKLFAFLAQALPSLLARVPKLDLLQRHPLALESLDRIIAVPEELGQGQMHDRAKNQAGAFSSGPQLFDVIEPVLLRAGQVAVNPRVRKMRRFSLRIETFLFLSNKRICHWRAPLFPCLGNGSTRV